MKQKRATIKDVAAEAGVSIAVVSYVLNNTPNQTIPETTKQKVHDAVQALDYTPNHTARRMRKQSGLTFGLVSFWGTVDPAFTRILDGISKTAQENDVSILFLKSDISVLNSNYIQAFKNGQIDGVILLSPHESVSNFIEEAHAEMIARNKLPTVIINGTSHHPYIKYINLDFYHSTYQCVNYLQSLGHQKIAYLLPDKTEETNKSSIERKNGFLDAISAFQLTTNNSTLFYRGHISELIQLILDGIGPTAIVANKSSYAREFMRIAFEMGYKIPDLVSIIAANAEPCDQFLFPRLTAMEIPLEEIGLTAAQLLLDMHEKKETPNSFVLPNKLFTGQSVKNI